MLRDGTVNAVTEGMVQSFKGEMVRDALEKSGKAEEFTKAKSLAEKKAILNSNEVKTTLKNMRHENASAFKIVKHAGGSVVGAALLFSDIKNDIDHGLDAKYAVARNGIPFALSLYAGGQAAEGAFTICLPAGPEAGAACAVVAGSVTGLAAGFGGQKLIDTLHNGWV